MSMYKSKPEFGSISWAMDYGENSLAKIKEIASASDFEKVRAMFEFYRDGRTASSAALTAIKHAPKLVKFKPHVLCDDMLWALCWVSSLEKGGAVYLKMRQIRKSENEKVSS